MKPAGGVKVLAGLAGVAGVEALEGESLELSLNSLRAGCVRAHEQSAQLRAQRGLLEPLDDDIELVGQPAGKVQLRELGGFRRGRQQVLDDLGTCEEGQSLKRGPARGT